MGINDRQDFFDIIPERLALEQRLASVHPINITAQRINFAVVRDVAIRMRPLPARKSIRTEARVDDGEGRLHRRIGEVRKIIRQLCREQHPLIDEGLHRQASDIPQL